jgi:hypothetical protein
MVNAGHEAHVASAVRHHEASSHPAAGAAPCCRYCQFDNLISGDDVEYLRGLYDKFLSGEIDTLSHRYGMRPKRTLT